MFLVRSMRNIVKCIIKINNVSEEVAKMIVNSLEPDNVGVDDKIVIKHEFLNGTLIYVLENTKSISSGMYTISDIVRNLNIVLKLVNLNR